MKQLTSKPISSFNLVTLTVYVHVALCHLQVVHFGFDMASADSAEPKGDCMCTIIQVLKKRGEKIFGVYVYMYNVRY